MQPVPISELDHEGPTAHAHDVVLPEDQPQLTGAQWRAIALYLYAQLDNIDTLDDAAKSNDAAYRHHARRYVQLRHRVGLTDGYRVIFPRYSPSQWPSVYASPEY